MLNPEAKPCDADLEALIADQAMRLHQAPTPAARRAAWEKLAGLVRSRTPQQVEALEIARGLR